MQHVWRKVEVLAGFSGKPKGRRPLGRPRCRWKDNINMDFKEVGWGTDWIDLVQERNRWRVVVNVVIKLQVP
jgi:hypothetical protein